MGSTGEVSSGEGRLQLVFCCSAGEEPEGLGLGEQKEQRRSAGRLPVLLAVSLIAWDNFNSLTSLDCGKCALNTMC